MECIDIPSVFKVVHLLREIRMNQTQKEANTYCCSSLTAQRDSLLILLSVWFGTGNQTKFNQAVVKSTKHQ